MLRQNEEIKEEQYTLPPLRSIEKIRTDLKASRGVLSPCSENKGTSSTGRFQFFTAAAAIFRPARRVTIVDVGLTDITPPRAQGRSARSASR